MENRDELFEEAGKLVVEKQKGSIGMLQRSFRINFNRASKIMDQLEKAGVVGQELGTRPREVLMDEKQFKDKLKNLENQKKQDEKESFISPEPADENKKTEEAVYTDSEGFHSMKHLFEDLSSNIFFSDQENSIPEPDDVSSPDASESENYTNFQDMYSTVGVATAEEKDLSSTAEERKAAFEAYAQAHPDYKMHHKNIGDTDKSADKAENDGKNTEETEEEVDFQDVASDEKKDPMTDFFEKKLDERESKRKIEETEKSSNAMTEETIYKDEVDRMANGVMRNGLIGKLIGVLKGAVAIVAEVAGTAFRHFVFGDRGMAEIGRTYRQYQNIGHMKSDAQSPKRNEQEMKKTERKQPEKTKETKEAKEAKKEAKEAKKEAKEVSREEKILKKASAVFADTDRAVLNEIAETAINLKPVQDMFSNIGYAAAVTKGDDTVHLLKEMGGTLGITGYGCSKEALLSGDASELAGSLYHANQIGKHSSSKLKAALDASLVIAAVMHQCGQEDGKTVELSNISFPSEDGISNIKVISKNGEAGLYYNGKLTAPVPDLSDPSQITGSVRNNMLAKLTAEQDKCHQTFTIGTEKKAIEFHKMENSQAVVTYISAEGKKPLGTYNFKEESAIHQLAKDLREAEWDKNRILQPGLINKLNSRTVAYTVAMVTYPEMEPLVGKSGDYRNAVTGKYEPAGAAHLSISKDTKGIHILKNIPKAGKMEHTEVCQYASISSIENINELAIQIHKASNEIRHTEEVIPDYNRAVLQKEDNFVPVKCNQSDALVAAHHCQTDMLLNTGREVKLCVLMPEEDAQTFEQVPEQTVHDPDIREQEVEFDDEVFVGNEDSEPQIFCDEPEEYTGPEEFVYTDDEISL